MPKLTYEDAAVVEVFNSSCGKECGKLGTLAFSGRQIRPFLQSAQELIQASLVDNPVENSIMFIPIARRPILKANV